MSGGDVLHGLRAGMHLRRAADPVWRHRERAQPGPVSLGNVPARHDVQSRSEAGRLRLRLRLPVKRRPNSQMLLVQWPHFTALIGTSI